MKNYPFQKSRKIILQPIDLGWGCDYTGAPVMAAEAWQFGVQKPRHAKRAGEIPPKDVSLENLPALYDWVEVRETAEIRDLMDAKRFVGSEWEADAYVVKVSTTAEAGPILAVLAQKNIPILPIWDNWGFAWDGRYVVNWGLEIGYKTFLSTGAEDVDDMLRAIRAASMLRHLKILYIGNIPSHSTAAECRPINLYRKFGVDFRQIDFKEYTDMVDGFVGTPEALALAEDWKGRYEMKDGRGEVLDRYTAIYLALHRLLDKYDANALTVDCAYSPSIDYVACCSASWLIDEGCCFACEGDISQIISLCVLMGVSGNAAMMGNLFENAIHADIASNHIAINHDVMPPSMACQDCRMCVRDFHDSKKGSTFFCDMPKEPVTIGGLSCEGSKFWVSKGRVSWVEDTVHCRITVGIEVSDAKDIMRRSIGDHQVMCYGEYERAAALAATFLGFAVDTI